MTEKIKSVFIQKSVSQSLLPLNMRVHGEQKHPGTLTSFTNFTKHINM